MRRVRDWAAGVLGSTPKLCSQVVDLNGTPYERGVTHGRLFKLVISKFIEKNLSNRLSKISGELLEEYKSKLLRSYSNRFPEVIQEIEGIATGAELPFSLLFDYNIQSILLVDLFPRPQSCTSMWMQTANGETLHGGSQDSGRADESYVIKRVNSQTGYSYVGTTIIGTTWTLFGMNTAGLTIGGSSVNIVRKDQDVCLDGIDVSCLTSVILESASSIEEAKKLLVSQTILPLGSGNVLLLCSPHDGAIKVEIHERDYGFVAPKNGVLISTNHFTGDLGQWNLKQDEYVRQLHDASVARYHVLQKHFEDQSNRTYVGIRNILTSHRQPGAICRHYGMKGELGQTTMAYIMVPSRGWMGYWIGNPCKCVMREITLKEANRIA